MYHCTLQTQGPAVYLTSPAYCTEQTPAEAFSRPIHEAVSPACMLRLGCVSTRQASTPPAAPTPPHPIIAGFTKLQPLQPLPRSTWRTLGGLSDRSSKHSRTTHTIFPEGFVALALSWHISHAAAFDVRFIVECPARINVPVGTTHGAAILHMHYIRQSQLRRLSMLGLSG